MKSLLHLMLFVTFLPASAQSSLNSSDSRIPEELVSQVKLQLVENLIDNVAKEVGILYRIHSFKIVSNGESKIGAKMTFFLSSCTHSQSMNGLFRTYESQDGLKAHLSLIFTEPCRLMSAEANEIEPQVLLQ